MTFHPAAVFRRSAQSIRHLPGLEKLTPVWNGLRAPYRRILARLAGTGGVPVMIGGYSIRLASDTVSLNWETVEVDAYKVFVHEIGSREVIYDVGAHFGTYTLIGLKRGGPGTRVVAYEPCELTRGYLLRHLRWNGAGDQVLVRPVCCGSTAGVATFFYEPGLPEGINGLLPDEGLAELPVLVTTLDEEVRELDLVPTFVKIDVEGAELEVLKGAAHVLSRHRPRLLLSLHPRRLAQAGLDCDAVRQWLTARDYQWRVVSEDQEVHVLARPA
jgi:FkbM family methyltransferase